MAPSLKAVFSLLIAPFKRLLWFLWMHVRVGMYTFDSVHDAPDHITVENYKAELGAYRKYRENASKKNHRYFIFPVILYVVLFVDTNYYLAQDNYEYMTKPMARIYTHRMYPPEFWYQGDMIVLSVSTAICSVNLALWLKKWLDDRYCMYIVHGPGADEKHLIVDGEIWDQENAEEIFKARKLNRKIMEGMVITTQIIADCYFIWNLSNAPFHDAKHYISMWIYLPMFMWYCCFSEVYMFYHFYAVTKYLMIKQKYLVRSLHDLNNTMRDEKLRKKTNFVTLWLRFREINRKLCYQCQEIAGYNRFWSIVLTCQFCTCMATFCYLLYVSLFYDATLDQMIYFVFFMVEIGGLIFAIIFRCSIVDHNNDLCYAGNVKAVVMFELFYHDKITKRQLASIETIGTNKNFSRCCFRLSNNYRLDSSAFNMAIYIISTLFLMICRRQRRLVEAKNFTLDLEI